MSFCHSAPPSPATRDQGPVILTALMTDWHVCAWRNACGPQHRCDMRCPPAYPETLRPYPSQHVLHRPGAAPCLPLWPGLRVRLCPLVSPQRWPRAWYADGRSLALCNRGRRLSHLLPSLLLFIHLGSRVRHFKCSSSKNEVPK